MKPISTFGVVSFKRTDAVRAVLATIGRWSHESNATVCYHPQLAELAPDSTCVAATEEEFLRRSEALVTVGGDGTFLAAAHMCVADPRPVIGVNLGGLGFLTAIGPGEVAQDLEKLRVGEYHTITRPFLSADLVRGGTPVRTLRALNDIYVNRTGKPKLASIAVWFGEEFITEFRCDGLIVATPAGSTAYSLSAGGPIVEPSVRTLLLTPICPHSLTERPIILPDDRPVRLVIHEPRVDVLLCADGFDTQELLPGDEVLVRCDRSHASLIQLARTSFFQSLRSKLGWGGATASRGTQRDDS